MGEGVNTTYSATSNFSPVRLSLTAALLVSHTTLHYKLLQNTLSIKCRWFTVTCSSCDAVEDRSEFLRAPKSIILSFVGFCFLQRWMYISENVSISVKMFQTFLGWESFGGRVANKVPCLQMKSGGELELAAKLAGKLKV